ncbi:hypothetical protein PSPO01_04166 [Paraphaeosphaeria sporulosa]
MSRLVRLDCTLPRDNTKKEKVVERHLPPQLVKNIVEKHVYLPDPKPAVKKKKEIIRHLEPERIKKTVNEHVYLSEPVIEVEHIVHYHHGSGSRQPYSTWHGSHHEYGEISKSAEKRSKKYVKAKMEESDSDDARKHISPSRRKERRREDDHSEGERNYSRNGKGKQKNDRRDDRNVPRRRNHHRKRLSGRSGRHDHDDRNNNSKKEHRARSRSRDCSHSRRHSSRKGSLSTETLERSSTKKREKSRAREPEPKASDQEDDEGDVYYENDTINSESKVSSSFTKRIEAPRKTPPVSSFDPYIALGLQGKRSTVDQVDIDASYKFLLRKWHPDRHMSRTKEEQDNATERTAELNRAYDILGNAGRRKVFDRTGKTEFWELNQLVEKEAKKEMAIARPGQGVLKNLQFL